MRQLDVTERILRLRMVPVFRSMPAASLAQLAAAIRPRTFRRGEVVLREDEPPRSFFLIGSGNVRMVRRGKRIGTVRGPGGVGFLPFLARSAGATGAVAQSFVEAYEVPGDAVEEVFEDDFSVMLASMRWVADRLLVEMKSATPPPYSPPDPPFEHLIGDRELGIVDRIYLLRRTRAFRAANVNSLARVARRMEEQRFPARTRIWSPGDVSDTSCFFVKGMAKLVWNEGRSEQGVGPGYVVGGTESLVAVPRWNELVTEEPVVLLRGRREALIDMFEDDREVALTFQSLLATFLMDIWDKKAEQGIASVGAPDSQPNGLGQGGLAPEEFRPAGARATDGPDVERGAR